MDDQRTDSALLNLAQAGDADAFCILASRYDTRLFQQAVGLARNSSLASDLASETIVEAWRSLPRFNGSSRFSTWLFAILLNRYRKHLSRNRSCFEFGKGHAHQVEHAPESIDTQPNPLELTIRQEKCHYLVECLSQLPDVHREVILLRFFQEASLGEIAAIQECSEGTVKSRLHYALEKLRGMKHIMNFLTTND